jgi:IMP dehydrogenase
VLDVANGHSDVCINALIKLKDAFVDRDVDIIAGSVATGEGAKQLIKAGADGIRCGIGNGSICITRVVSGCGVP